MIHISLTGGIGSGKSVVGKVFSLLGAYVLQADEMAKDLYKRPELLAGVTKAFGSHIVRSGVLDKKALADIVFNDADALKQLNALTHPEVMKVYRERVQHLPANSICMMESAIVFEAGLENEFDKIVTVYAPQELCISRIIDRDVTERAAIIKRMQHQWSPEKKRVRADFVILNDDTQLVIPQVIACYKSLKLLAK